MAERIHSFPPVFAGGERLLVLGSCPSVESLKRSFYYAHPRNTFWRILSEAAGAPLPDSIQEKKGLLSQLGVALWDVVESCERQGSLDSAILRPLPNDIAGLLEKAPDIKRVLCNGKASLNWLVRLCPDIAHRLNARALPSTSPAYTLPYEQKRDRWMEALLERAPERPERNAT